jgi:hypothetical protein
MTAEAVRMEESRQRKKHWKRWGPYVSERAWSSVREDYSAGGTAWDYFPHDHARSRAYRWNEDGLAGICDRHQRICFAIALWNRRDPILKERLFGLTSRLSRIFLRGTDGRRPVFGGLETFQNDPHWRDLIPFYEYFHGDNGAGIGASHQTGWTALVAKLLQQSGKFK